MGELNFDHRQCLCALKYLGFSLGNKRSGQHDKFYPPSEIAEKITGLQPRFIMIPRHKKLHCQSEIISEIKAMGGDDLVKSFKDNL
ncbi:TPA: hypothetical protein DEA21_03510 [Candidatus Uhrbacteria bacterium]|nr:hypothetical protein [Candidatus Uhrbacteria bacterium]HCU31169.1 hypothetical protein [Candidatus Uhrbacteria bacterium]